MQIVYPTSTGSTGSKLERKARAEEMVRGYWKKVRRRRRRGEERMEEGRRVSGSERD